MAVKHSRRSSQRPRVHPGAILREDVLPAVNKRKTEIAQMLGVSRQTLYDILAERKPITPAMALRIGKLTGTTAMSWLAMQQAYDLWHAEREIGKQVAAIPTLEVA